MDRLMIVDDDVDWVGPIGPIVSQAGYECRVLSRSRDIDHAVAEWAPTVLMLDIVMPEKDGFEVLSALTTSGFAGAVVLVSKSDQMFLRQARDLAAAYALNVVAALRKPIDADLLAKLLQDLKRSP
jgi:DNA-binding NtrC family response regulator